MLLLRENVDLLNKNVTPPPYQFSPNVYPPPIPTLLPPYQFSKNVDPHTKTVTPPPLPIFPKMLSPHTKNVSPPYQFSQNVAPPYQKCYPSYQFSQNPTYQKCYPLTNLPTILTHTHFCSSLTNFPKMLTPPIPKGLRNLLTNVKLTKGLVIIYSIHTCVFYK